jgi:hypothetical protein
VAAIRQMLAAGLTLDQALIAGEAMEQNVAPSIPRETTDERKKRLARERTDRWRASQSVTTASPSVTERHDVTHLTRVGDNITTIQLPGLTNTGLARGRPIDHGELLEILLMAGGRAVSDRARCPGIASAATILRLLEPGTGPPCDLDLDVLPAIRARCLTAQPNSIRAWAYFENAILENRDRRLAGAPAIKEIQDVGERKSAKLTAKEANMARAFRAAESVAAGAG